MAKTMKITAILSLLLTVICTLLNIKIANDISRESAVKIREQSSKLAGMNIITEPIVANIVFIVSLI